MELTNLLEVSCGKIEGSHSSDGELLVFKGIPYAKPPIGELRWKAPQPTESWAGILKCTSFSKSAIQNEQAPFMCWSEEFIIDTKLGYSEDCLYLNIWTKKEVEKDNLKPVIVYIHGGANVSGGSSCEVYNGEAIAKKDVVYVSINYRVGIMGFLAHPELSAESKENVSGNYAILDQILALQWIQENIHNFGGDRNNVTISGQSAGSLNVNALITSPLGKGLFKNAVAMSLNPITFPTYTLDVCEKNGQELFNNMSIKELRAMDAFEIQKIASQIGLFGANIDGYVLKEGYVSSYIKGFGEEVNLMTGMVDGDEVLMSLLTYDTEPLDKIGREEYEVLVERTFGQLASEFMELYPTDKTNPALVVKQIDIDANIAYQYLYGKIRSQNKNVKTYIYNFSRIMPGPESEVMGAFHTADVPYWFNYFTPLRSEYWTKVDFNLGNTMLEYLCNFVKTGNPNDLSGSLPEWKSFDSNKVSYMSFDDVAVMDEFDDKKANLWFKYFENIIS